MKSLLLLLLTATASVLAQNIRPIRDSVGFCWRANEMDKVISFLSKDAANKYHFNSEGLVAAISPHDDFLYAGRVYYPLYPLIKAKEIVIFGVTHGTVRKAMNDPQNILIFDSYKKWRGPYGLVNISPLREKLTNSLPKDFFMVSNKAQRIEHSIEALIPFLQHYNRNLTITPIMVTQMPFERMENISAKVAEIIKSYIKEKNLKLGKDIFFLISNDANHYGKDFNNSPYGLDSAAHRIATSNDRRILNSYINAKITGRDLKELTGEIWHNNSKPIPLWCGRYPIIFGLLTVRKIVKTIAGKEIEGKLFKYSDTLTQGKLPIKGTHLGLTAPVSTKHWVGFFSAGFYLKYTIKARTK